MNYIFVAEIQNHRNTESQKYRITEIGYAPRSSQKYGITEIQNHRNTESQKYRITEIQNDRNTESQKYRITEIG